MALRVACLIAALCVMSCASAPSSMPAAPRPQVDVTLGAGDVFDVRVFEEPDLSGSYKIDPTGSIDYPLVGRVQVAGLLPSQLAALLREKLAAAVRNPQVSVLVREVNSKHVIVYGQVQKPGSFPYAELMTVSQAISLAGGFTAMAKREEVRVFRRENNQQRGMVLDLRAIAEGHAPNQFVAPGDEIYVPERLF